MDLNKIFKDNADCTVEMQHQDTLKWEDFECMSEDVFTDVVKKLLIQRVSSRRELLKGFASKFNDRLDRGDGVAIMDWMIDEFLETL